MERQKISEKFSELRERKEGALNLLHNGRRSVHRRDLCGCKGLW